MQDNSDNMKKGFSVILTADEKGGIENQGKPLCRLKEDMAFFKKITTEAEKYHINAVVMERNTWLSIPEKFRPLKGRLDIVLASDRKGDSLICESLDEVLECLQARKDVEKIFIIGGARLYKEALKSPLCKEIYLTHICGVFEADTKVPLGLLPPAGFVLKDQNWEPRNENGIQFQFLHYVLKTLNE